MTAPSARLAPLFVLATCAGAMATALIAQYVFGLKPCELCLIQRVPFVVAGLLALITLMRPRLSRLLLPLAALLLLGNAGIAFYHVGVEQHWWASACSGKAAAISLSDLAAQMAKPVEARCDEPSWEWHGITMALMNVPFSALLGVITLGLFLKAKA